jgi:hypothetical protein
MCTAARSAPLRRAPPGSGGLASFNGYEGARAPDWCNGEPAPLDKTYHGGPEPLTIRGATFMGAQPSTLSFRHVILESHVLLSTHLGPIVRKASSALKTYNVRCGVTPTPNRPCQLSMCAPI